MTEAIVMKNRSLEKEMLFEDSFFSDGGAFVVYLIIMTQEGIINNDTLLLKEIVKLIDYDGVDDRWRYYISSHNTDIPIIVFYILSLEKDKRLRCIFDIEGIRLDSELNSILGEVFKQNIITPEELIRCIFDNRVKEGSSELLEKLLCEYPSKEITKLLEDLVEYNDIPYSYEDMVANYLNRMKESV